MSHITPYQEEIIATRYLWPERKENWEMACHRIAEAVFAREKGNASKYIEEMAESLYYFNFLFGGRVLRNAGRPKGNLLNCAGLVLEDDTHKIGMFIHDSLMIWKKGAGLGFVTNLRPKGAPLLTDGYVSSGAVSWLQAINRNGEVIQIGGQRRAAGLCMMHVSHPEILSFMDAKLKEGELSCFNISVIINNAFLDAVEQNGAWTFSFAGKDYGTVQARDLWMRIMKNMVHNGEPGLINWDNFIKNNSYYFAPVQTCNACGEQPMENYGSCCLGAINYTRYLTEGGQLKRADLEATVRLTVRALDNILDITYYPLDEMERTAELSRRIGLGGMGLADVFFAKEMRYGDERSLNITSEIYKLIRNTAYDESIKLARDKGPFPAFDATAFCKASFVRKLPSHIRLNIKKYGIRNVALLSGQPTGTTSLVAGVSSGIEPIPSLAFRRSDNIGTDDRTYIHPILLKYLKNQKPTPKWLVDALTISPADHLNMLEEILNKVDSNVSKTCNLKAGTKPEELSDILLDYMRNLKSVTIYVDGSRKKQVIYPMTMKEVRKYLKEKDPEAWKGIELECKGGVCEL